MTEVHLRGSNSTACGIAMYQETWPGNTVTTVYSVGDHRLPDQPVTCPDCLVKMSEL